MLIGNIENMMKSPRSSHTHLQAATSPHTDQSLQKSVPAPPKKNFKIFFPNLQKKLKHAIAQPVTDRHKNKLTMTRKTQPDSDFQTWWTRTPAANSGFASCGVTVVNSSAVFQFNFSAGLTVLCPEIPHERKAAKR